MHPMVPITPTGVPSEVVAGDSWRWRIADLADYPQSEGWTLTYELGGIDKPLTITGVWQTSGDDQNHWLISEALATTDQVSEGLYTLVGRMVGSGTYAGREETISISRVFARKNPREARAGDYQSHAERTLAVIEAVIEGRFSVDMESYSVGGRSVSKIPIRELYGLRGKYAAMVLRERTGRVGQQVKARFPRVA